MRPDLKFNVAVGHYHKYLPVIQCHMAEFEAEMVIAFFGVQDVGVVLKIVALVEHPSLGHDLGLVKESAGGFHDRSISPQVTGDLVDVLVLAPGFLFSLAAIGAVSAFIVAVLFIGASEKLLSASGILAPAVENIGQLCHIATGNQ